MRDATQQEEQNTMLLAESDGCAVWQLRNETGEGTVTCYTIFPGVELRFRDLHMTHCVCGKTNDRMRLTIEHCREGRMAYALGEGAFSYVSAGEMKLENGASCSQKLDLPSGHYHGLVVTLDPEQASHSLLNVMAGFSVTPAAILRRFALNKMPKVIACTERVTHIFEEMYRVPEKARISYFQIKILELLLALDSMTPPKENTAHPYFYKTQLEKTKAVRDFLAEHISENFTQEELSARFDFALTPMKTCFKAAYGTSIGAWLTDYRMNYAAEILLREKRRNIAEIAAQVGYDSASKFAAAFKKVKHMTPAEYRSALR